MSFLEADETRTRAILARQMPGASEEEVQGWLGVEPRSWVVRHAPTLHQAGLRVSDAVDLYQRLGPGVAESLSNLVFAGRMADIDLRYVHLWAASGLLRPASTGNRPGRPSPPNFTRWVTQARRFITACGGDQHMAAAAAAAGLSVQETTQMHAAGELQVEALGTLAALRGTSLGAEDR